MNATDHKRSGKVNFTGQSGATWRYRTDRPLGTPGGFGRVYVAEGPEDTPMAVKVHQAGPIRDTR